jgi:hypothetical protein
MRRHYLGCVLAICGAATAWADHKDDFRKGMEAIATKDWARVEQLMRSAIRQKPKEGESVRVYGVRYETYLPQYYLGVALLNQGDCKGATAAWAESERQGAIQKTPWFAMLRQDVEGCQSRLARATMTPPPVMTPAPDPTHAVARQPSPTPAADRSAETLPRPADAGSAKEAAPESSRSTLAPVAQVKPSGMPASAPSPSAKTSVPVPGDSPLELAAVRPSLEAFFGGRYREARTWLSQLVSVDRWRQSQPLLLILAAAAAAEIASDSQSQDAVEVLGRTAPLIADSTIRSCQKSNLISPSVLERIVDARIRAKRAGKS